MSNCPSVNWTHCKYYCYISKSTMFMCILIFQLSFQRIICLFTFWSTISGNIKAFQIVLPNVQTAVSSYWLFWGQHRQQKANEAPNVQEWFFFFPGDCVKQFTSVLVEQISHTRQKLKLVGIDRKLKELPSRCP